MGRRLGRGDTTKSINLGRLWMNPRVGTTFRDMRGTGGGLEDIGTLGGVGRSRGDGLRDGVGGYGVALGGRMTHLWLRLCHAASSAASIHLS